MHCGRRTNPARAAALLISLTLLITLPGCANVAGTPHAGDWTSSPVYPALQSTPATADSKWEIGLVDPTELNRLNQFSDNPLPTTTPAPDRRPPAEYAWERLSISGSACANYLDQIATMRNGGTVRTGPPDDMLTVLNGRGSAQHVLGACAGEIDMEQVRAGLGDPAEPRTVGGVAGSGNSSLWVGQRAGLTYLVGADIPPETADAVVSGAATATSLAADADVRAVLDANPRAAMIEMGTVLIGNKVKGLGDDTLEALLDDVETTTGTALPAPRFGGYGWTPGAQITGTGTFVTVYVTADDAAAAAKVLSAVWPKAPDSRFATATTSVSGTVVRTDVTGAEPNRFDLRALRLLEYPGYHGG